MSSQRNAAAHTRLVTSGALIVSNAMPTPCEQRHNGRNNEAIKTTITPDKNIPISDTIHTPPTNANVVVNSALECRTRRPGKRAFEPFVNVGTTTTGTSAASLSNNT